MTLSLSGEKGVSSGQPFATLSLSGEEGSASASLTQGRSWMVSSHTKYFYVFSETPEDLG